jgi:serine/threonine-protein kinase
VFLTRMGDRDDFVKVLDFGISKFVGPETDAAVTQTGMVVGTPYYMSPEQARGAKDLDARVDVYAAGVILFQMLTGRLPYVGESYNEIIGAILLDPFPSPSDLRPDVPPAIESVILRATARERSVRYADARALREALAEAAGGISRPPSIDPLAAGPTIAVPSTPAPAPDDIGSQRTVAAGSTGGAGRSAPPAAEPHVPSTRSATARGVATPAFPLGDRTSVSARRRKAVAAVLVIAAAVGVLVFVFADPTAGGRAGPGAPAAGGVPESTAASATDPRPAATPAPVVIPVPVVAPPPLPAAPAPPAGDASNEAASPTAGTVRIALAGLPEGARVEVDGAEVEGPVLDLPRGDAEVEIRIAADGWIDWSARVVPSGDREIVYDGRRAEPPGTRPPRRDAGPRPPPDAGAALPGFGEGP